MRSTAPRGWTALFLLLQALQLGACSRDSGYQAPAAQVPSTATTVIAPSCPGDSSGVSAGAATAVATGTATAIVTSTATTTGSGVVTGVISGTVTASATVTYVQTVTNSDTVTITGTFTAATTLPSPGFSQTNAATGTTARTQTSLGTDTGIATRTTAGTGTNATSSATATSSSSSTVPVTGTQTGSRTATGTATPTATVTSTATATAVPITVTPYTGPPIPRVDNPYQGATGYVNPDWKAKADAEASGSRVSNTPTGVWLDRIAAIAGTSTAMGLRAHLDAAVAQGAGYIQFVIYNLPGRDCAALSSNGELGPTDLPRYKTEYIDPIALLMSDAKYINLRIINIIEIDSLPNLVTNTGGSASATPMCDTMKANGNYSAGIAYALGKLHALTNTYNYIDAAHHGWIGWDNNFGATADMMATTAKAATGGFDTVTGFITNTANYSALVEPFLTVSDTTRQSKWIDWNRYVDEQSFATAFRARLITAGFNSNIGMLIDTSRNGWGGPNRPTAASAATDVNTMINASRIDRRIHLGNWCNQSGAGLGERPKAVGASGIHAYVWIKPPGESDGASSVIQNDQGKGFDRMCDPTYTGNARNGNNMSGALPNSPLAGTWFSAQFQELMANAYPPL
jgi:cellulose 1,4-beta-cellobiosidase